MRLFTILMLSMALLSSCSGNKEDDLDRWMKESRTRIKGKVEPLPEIKKYEPFLYNADGSLADPFRGRRAVSTEGTLQPDMKRPREALEAFPLESLKFVGSLEQASKNVALLAAPDSNVYQIRVGNYVGQNFGLVTKINKDEIVVKEMVQDGTGGYEERLVTISPEDTTQQQDTTQKK